MEDFTTTTFRKSDHYSKISKLFRTLEDLKIEPNYEAEIYYTLVDHFFKETTKKNLDRQLKLVKQSILEDLKEKENAKI